MEDAEIIKQLEKVIALFQDENSSNANCHVTELFSGKKSKQEMITEFLKHFERPKMRSVCREEIWKEESGRNEPFW